MTDEHTLLREFTERCSRTAFRELEARYTDFVFSAALRQCGPARRRANSRSRADRS